MDQLTIRLNDPETYDRYCRGPDCLPDAGDLIATSKDVGTVQGRPLVLLAHGVQLPDGSLKVAQTTITGRLFAGLAAAFQARYGYDGSRVTVPASPGAPPAHWPPDARVSYQEQAHEIKRLRAELRTHRDKANGDYWSWQGDGEDHLESLTCPVLIRPEALRALLAGSGRTPEGPSGG